MKKKPTLYVAAALFNSRESLFNIKLTEGLEQKGYKVFLPQRDGFEFDHLSQYLENDLSSEEISTAVPRLIYYLDMGWFLPQSQVVVANLDEPVDEGVAVELSYSRLAGRKIIGFRTDIRSPFGSLSEPLRGTHYFPVFQCDFFIVGNMPCRHPQEADRQIQKLIDQTDLIIKTCPPEKRSRSDQVNLPLMSILTKGASLLFQGIVDIHKESSLQKICQRYLKHQSFLGIIEPVIRRMGE